MLNSLTHPIRLPKYYTLAEFEGKGNWAIAKYYKWPYRFFYRHKLKMIVDMLRRDTKYHNILDYGSGPGIFTEELKQHAHFVKSFDVGQLIDPRWKFDVIVCSSVLEFMPNLDFTLVMLKSLLKKNGILVVGSPMNTWITRLYLSLIKDKHTRNSHIMIQSKVSKYFNITESKEWLNLYFSLKAVSKG